jgi:glucose-1-phosphate thymidylyltransferase
MKGIILAGGKGTRLNPLTSVICKQLLPVYNKPMIFYPLSTLLLLDITEILIITNPKEDILFKKLLGDGSDIGCQISYMIQERPNGIAEAFILGKDFIAKDSVCLILGDNIFYGSGLGNILRNSVVEKGASVFGIEVDDPSRFGVVEFDEKMNVISIEEKPYKPKSNYAIPGLYFYDNTVVKKSNVLNKSKRGELEITDLNKKYLEENLLKVTLLPRGTTWLDTGTHESLFEANQFVKVIEHRSLKKISCIEEIAFLRGHIDFNTFKKSASRYKGSDYGDYLKKLIKNLE